MIFYFVDIMKIENINNF